MRCSLLFTLLLGCLSNQAFAQDEELAKSHFKLGIELYNRSDYAGALAQFQKAYEYSQKPELQFNMARCHESLGNYQQAIDAFEAYLQTHPSDRSEIDTRIANLKRLNEAKINEDKALREKAEKAEAAEAEAARLKKLQEEQAKLLADPGPPWNSRKGWTGMILAGTGVVATTIGLVFGAMASSKANEIQTAYDSPTKVNYVDDNPDKPNYRDLESQGKSFNTIAIVGLVTGVTALVAGGSLITWHYLGHEAPSTSTAWFEPVISSDSVTMNAGFRY